MSWEEYFAKGFGGTKDGSTFMQLPVERMNSTRVKVVARIEYIKAIEKRISKMREEKANGQ